MPPTIVVYVVSTLQRTGPTTQLLNLVKNLDLTRYKPQIVTLSPEPKDSLKDQFLSHGVDVKVLDLSRMQGAFRANKYVRDVIRQTGAQLVHTQGIRADAMVSSSAYRHISRIATLRNYPQLDYPLTYGRSLGKLMSFVHTRCLKRLDLTVGVSRPVTENLRKLVPHVTVTTVMNGVDTDVFEPVNEFEKQQIRNHLGFSSSATIWLVSGHLSQRKDPITLIEGFKNAFGDDCSQLLILIGAGPLEDAARSLTQGCGNIRIEGRVSDVRSYLQASDFYVSASMGEGLPNAALEAMACGLPVLISDIEPHHQLLEMKPGIGVSFETGNAVSLKKGFRTMMDCDIQVMRQSAIELTKNELSARAMAVNYQNLYDELMTLGAGA
ncbi:glycosyltransferase [Marinobacter sp. ATCH36]|uniref:glycosyltransferase n=1 Tax=Marinobacter sp. ATCH36 TaxID=2945106 RepID=UPI002021E184|nr:glycosyltransferase [Marinobacter sp. ATCH36]MCL7945107.1 glycosyltransferase [Marinobacter sp. ATCH36]